MEIRMELEKEIRRLKDENSALRTENKQLHIDKVAAEQQLISFKQKSDDIIAQLRGTKTYVANFYYERMKCDYGLIGKLVEKKAIKTTTKSVTSAIESAGPRIGPPQRKQVTHGPQTPVSADSADMAGRGGVPTNFAGPTFSELMRR